MKRFLKIVPLVAIFMISCFETVRATPVCCDSDPLSITPSPRQQSYEWMSMARWYRMHADDVEIAEKGEAPIVFIGDSITEMWKTAGKNVWEEHFKPLGAVTLGIGGDMTQNLLWRMDHGSIGNLKPKKVICLIGINNFGFTQESPETISKGVIAVVEKLKKSFPESEMLVFGVFPSGQLADDPIRTKIQALNAITQQVGTWDNITYMDIWDRFLDENGVISEDIMPDFLHPNEKGYEIWADAILEWLKKD